MGSLHIKLALAVGAAVACIPSIAAAQQTPPFDDGPAKRDMPDMPDTPDTHSTTTTTTTHTQTAPQTTPQATPQTTTTTTMPPQTSPGSATGTTQTTSAEYNEMASAERERTYQPNRPMLITGAAMVLLPYAAGVIVASQSDLDADKRNYIPVVGPWLDLGQRPCSFGSNCTTTDNVGSGFLIASGVAQGVGVLLAAASFAVPEKTTVHAEPKATMQIMPMSFVAGGGLGAIGTF